MLLNLIELLNYYLSRALMFQTPDAFEVEYTKRANEGGFEILDVGVRLYDIMWMLAIALNNTMSMVRSGDISETGCDNVPGSLVPLEEFNYTNERMGCLIQWNLQTTDYTGVSVSFTRSATKQN